MLEGKVQVTRIRLFAAGKMRKGEVVPAGIALLSFVVGIYFYPHMPDEMAIHWNASGQADGYASKSWGFFFLPAFSLLMLLVLLAIPKIDPLRENIEKFRKHYDRFLALMSTLFLYLYLLVVLWNMGFRFDLLQLLTPMLGVLFYFMGVLTENAKKNWSIGVRTPWTLTSEIVWDKTNRIFGRLFRVAGVVVGFGLLFPGYALFFMFIPALLVTVFSIIYSYVEYQKQPN